MVLMRASSADWGCVISRSMSANALLLSMVAQPQRGIGQYLPSKKERVLLASPWHWGFFGVSSALRRRKSFFRRRDTTATRPNSAGNACETKQAA